VSDIKEVRATKRIAAPSDALRVAETFADAAAWDDFAQRAGASYLCSNANLRGEKLRTRGLRRLAVFMEGRQVAQCAVVTDAVQGRRGMRFVDSVQVLPEHALLWPRIMTALLRYLGAGRYFYGGKWNVEAPRSGILRLIPGVTIVEVAHYTVNAVDFGRWPDWAAYERDISSNAKRSVIKAKKADPGITISIDQGAAAAFRHVVPLTILRWRTNRRKGLTNVAIPVDASRYFLRSTLMGQNSFTARAIMFGRTTAYFSGMRYGANTFYLHGASTLDSQGGSWFLMLEMLHRAWRPDGKFMLGMYLTGSDWAGRDNILLSRRHCRATDFPNELVEFEFRENGFD
jgi:hypothetical protein